MTEFFSEDGDGELFLTRADLAQSAVDDGALWDEYVRACRRMHLARLRVTEASREPTQAERDAAAKAAIRG